MHVVLKRGIQLGLALGLCLGVWLLLRPEPIMVDAAAVTRGPMQITVDEEGVTRIRERYVVSAPLAGRLQRITLDPADPVRADETIIATIEPTPPELLDPRAIARAEARVRGAGAALARASAVLERAQAEYELAERELARVARAFDSNAANQSELDEARTAERTASRSLDVAADERDIARFELDVARAALLYARGESPDDTASGRMHLTSPIDGAVLRVLRESVTVVAPGEPLIEVGDPRDLEIVIDVLSADGVRIDAGDRVVIDHWGGAEPLDARVRLVEPSAFTHVSALGIEEQRVNVIAEFVSPPEQRLSLGDRFRVEARIIIWETDNALLAPSSSVFRVDDGFAVFVVDDGVAELTPVAVGRRNGRVTQILGGLSPGDAVVLHPSDRLGPGSRIRVRPLNTVGVRRR
jgi:HlyD family secretion protein